MSLFIVHVIAIHKHHNLKKREINNKEIECFTTFDRTCSTYKIMKKGLDDLKEDKI